MTQALAVLPAPGSDPGTPTSRSAQRTALRKARAQTILTAFHDLDRDLARSLVTLCADHDAPDLPTMDAALAWLAQGLTIRIACHNPSSNARYNTHKIGLHGDGTLEVLSHGTDLYLDGEMMLAALSGRTPHCFTAATLIPTGRRVTRDSLGTNSLRGGWQTLDNKVRSAWAAVQWAAQRPEADWSTIGPLLRHGLTPALHDEWLAHGWTIAQAKPFIAHYVPVPLANEWRATGQTTAAAASVAGLGQRPTVTQEWTRQGFTPAEAARWHRLTSLSPAEARRWQAAGFRPRQAAQAIKNHQTCGSRHPNPADLLAWAEAGVPAKSVPFWMSTTNGNLSDAVLYTSVGLEPWAVNSLQRPMKYQRITFTGMQRIPAVPIAGWVAPTAQEVVDMINSGVAPDAESLIAAFCRAQGLSR